MISTVTTSTITTVTSTTLAGSVALIGILVLLVLLVQKELSSAVTGERYKSLSKVLDVGIIPLMIAFALVVVTRIAQILS